MNDNCSIKVEGSKVTIEFDASVAGARSSSGKTFVIASTRGSTKVEAMGRELMVGLNVFTKQEKVVKLAKVS